MAEGKKSVLLYCDLIHTIEKMDDNTAGVFFKHYLRYINDLTPVTDNLVVDLTFESVKQNLKRDLKKWETRAERSRENGKLGGRPKKDNPEEPNGLINNLTEPRKPDTVKDTVTVTVTDKVKGINTINTPPAKAVVKIDFDKLLLFINKTTGRSFKVFNNTLKTKYKARLKEGYTKEDIQTAVRNAVKAKNHIETNNKHLTLEFFSRADKLDMHSDVSKTPVVGLSIKEQTEHIKNTVGKNSI